MPSPLDLVLFGATGFTGRLVAQHLQRRHPAGTRQVRWGIAGRSRAKLEALRDELDAPDLDLVVADSRDRASLDAMCAGARVVCTTVGPYAEYGSALVAACVAAGTDYCDLSGEVPWMHRMIHAHHRAAYDGGVRIVHSCGFDSVPSDVGVLHLQRTARERFGSYCEETAMLVAGAKGGFSGGTYASLAGVIAEANRDPAVARVLADPFALNHPAPPGDCRWAGDQRGARWNLDFQTWTAPFVMAAINTRIVQRSHALAGFPYGREFCYAEALGTGIGYAGRLAAKAMATGIGAVMRGGKVAKLAQRFAPDPGEGPSAAEREAGYFKLKFYGRTAAGQALRTVVRGRRDPGYGCTSRMLGESALALAETHGQGRTGGVLTPALALGDELLERLPRHADVTFGVEERG